MAETKDTDQLAGAKSAASYITANVEGIEDTSTDYAVVFEKISDDNGWIGVGAFAFLKIEGKAVTANADITVEYRATPDSDARELATDITLTAGSGITDVVGTEAQGKNITGAGQVRVITTLSANSITDLYLLLKT